MARPMRWIGSLLALGLLAAGGAAWLLQQQGVTPRALAPYVAKRSSGHNGLIVGVGELAAATLLRLDRGASVGGMPVLPALGVQAKSVGAEPGGTPRLVATPDEARQAIVQAQPGDVITFLPGVYRFSGAPINAARAGTDLAPVVVRAVRPGSVTLELDMTEGFVVSAPHWRFENLVLKGACKTHSACEHAFHVVGAASHFKSLNNTITDFNAHFKINGSHGRFPDHGRIENNTLRNDSVRNTSNPVTPIDLVAASHWKIRRNLISDFVKGGGDRISYGGFAKGAGAQNVFEQNAVVCEARLQQQPGQRVGLSLGGGGSGAAYCRDKRCVVEQEQSEIRGNLIAACSDDGIYLNNAAGSRITHNTLLDTGGVQVRFSGSSADLEGNLIDGDIRSRNDAVVRAADNRTTPIALLYAGYHPVRSLFAGAPRDLAWNGAPPRRPRGKAFVPDLCGAQRGEQVAYGAFEDIGACMR